MCQIVVVVYCACSHDTLHKFTRCDPLKGCWDSLEEILLEDYCPSCARSLNDVDSQPTAGSEPLSDALNQLSLDDSSQLGSEARNTSHASRTTALSDAMDHDTVDSLTMELLKLVSPEHESQSVSEQASSSQGQISEVGSRLK